MAACRAHNPAALVRFQVSPTGFTGLVCDAVGCISMPSLENTVIFSLKIVKDGR